MKFQKQQTPWNKGKKLHYPIWNKGKKGIHLSPDTEFKKGSRGFTGKHSEESKLKMSLASKGRIMSDESRKKISLALKGKTPKNIVAGWNKGMKMPPMSEETRLKYSLVQKERVKLGLNNLLNGDGAKGWNKGIKLPQITGDKHWNWQGGISPERQKYMRTLEYKSWRDDIFKKNDYSCQFCKKRGERIEADHIKPFAWFSDLRFWDDNSVRYIYLLDGS